MTPSREPVLLAAIDDSPAAARVLGAATALAAVLGGTVEALHVDGGERRTAVGVAEQAGTALRVVDGEPATEILRAATEPGVDLVVIGSRRHSAGARPTGHVTRTVLQQIDRPVLVVPPDAPTPDPRAPYRRALFPFEGTKESSGSVTDALHRLAEAGVELVGVHVFNAETAPAFWDQTGHAETSWASEFASRWCAGSDVDLHLRRGAAPESIVELAATEDIDLIVLTWSQDMTAGRAAVVQTALGQSHVPVLLVPTRAPSTAA